MKCCSTKKKPQMFPLKYLSTKTRFGEQELFELKKRFLRMSNNQNFITKLQFRENLGLLGLGTVYYLSDRIFSILDNDRDGKIHFEDFVLYFDIISNGDSTEKAEISFKLIDINKQGYFMYDDFQNCMQGIISSWTVMTGQHLTQELKKQLDIRMKFIFSQMDLNKDGQVTQEEYQQSVVQDPNLLEIFDFLNQKESTNEEIEFQQLTLDEEQKQTNKLKQIEMKIDNLIQYLRLQPQNEKQKCQPSMSFNNESNQEFDIQFEESKEITFLKPPSRSPLFKTSENSKQKDIYIKKADNQLIKQFQTVPYIIGDIDLTENISQRQRQRSHQNICNLPSFQIYNKYNEFGEVPTFTAKVSMKNIQIDQNKKQIQFQKIQPKMIQDTEPDFDFQQNNNLNMIEQSVLSQMIEDDFDNVPISQLKNKCKEAIQQVTQIQEDIKQLRIKMEQEKYTKEKQILQNQAKEQTMIMLKASTVFNIHKQKQKQKQKKPKITVAFGHENFNLVLNMMIGIQMAIKSINTADDYVLVNKDFKLKYYFELLPRRTGSEKTTFKVCKFYDYAPQVFNSIRTIYGVDNDQYLKSIGPETLLSSLLKGDLSTLEELTSTGKSGSFFYYTADGQFTLKTVHRHEFTFLKQILKSYYNHLKIYTDTLIIKFFGMHKIGIKYHKKMKEKRLYFVIMSNVFHTHKEIHERFDLKGSLYKRITNDADPSVAKKELNWLKQKMRVEISATKQIKFLQQIHNDCQFFSENNIIDYSLLLGIHYKKNNKMKQNIDTESSMISDEIYIQQFQDSISQIQSENNDKIYYFGIIDILTYFRQYQFYFTILNSTKKKIEFLAKRVTQGPNISAIPPKDYADRFEKFIQSIFN